MPPTHKRSLLIGLGTAATLCLFLVACSAFEQIVPAPASTSDSRPIPPPLAPVPTPTPRPWSQTDNYLILGIDQRPGDGSWRTDSIILAAVARGGGRVGLLSIPRDLYIDIPGVGEARINQADFLGEKSKYPGGGPALLRRVLTQTLGIDAPHYVRINMQVFERVVDAFGGVTITLPCPFLEATPDSNGGLKEWGLPAGDNWLNGQDARKFATYRYYSTDFDRARRQQIVLWALRNRALQTDAITRLPELWTAYSESVQTDLGFGDILRLAQIAMQLQPEDVSGLTFDFSLVESITTDGGARVLRVRDPEALHRWLDNIFDAQPIEAPLAANRQCPPLHVQRGTSAAVASDTENGAPAAAASDTGDNAPAAVPSDAGDIVPSNEAETPTPVPANGSS
jgi:LCP family protein required for cell wall assembly